jgi:hypothetical protein
LIEYSGEDFDTNVTDIDLIEDEQAYHIDMTMAGGGSGNYVANENVKLSSVVVGEVISWNPTTRQLKIRDNTKTLVVGDVLVGADGSASHTISSIVDVMTMSNDGAADNLDFETKADNYLDFSETNPFGEVT